MDRSVKYIIGIDEVGRGPIAGPVAVCSFLCQIDFFENIPAEQKLPKLKDSKKLSKKQREKWFSYLQKCKKEGKCDFQVSYVPPENIDKFGIVKCIQKALNESLNKLIKTSPLKTRNYKLMLDGGLHAPAEYVHQETFIKGDELYPVISCASIVAKVSRDKIMVDYEKEFPDYGFPKHSGYGTKAHYEAIKKRGFTPIHRKTFIH